MTALSPSMIGTAVRMVPVVLIVILSFPAWLTWPFLSEERRKSVLQMVRILARWAIGDSAIDHDDGEDQTAEGDSVEPMPDKPPLHNASCGVVIEGRHELG
jgi:hypothetical protein